MRLYTQSQKKRHDIATLITQGATIDEAENIVLKGDSNRVRNIAKWQELKLYPYGEIDPPREEIKLASSLSLPKDDSVTLDQIKSLIDNRMDQLMAQEISLIKKHLTNLEDKLSAVQKALRD
jgi:hypothetical protein